MDVSDLKEEAQALFLRRRYAACAKVYRRLTELEPEDARLYVRYAEASQRARVPLQAAAAYRSAARVLVRQGQLARAHAALKMALALEPEHTGAQVAMANVERQRASARGGPAPAASGLREDSGVELPVGDDEASGPLQVRRISEFAVAVRQGARGLWLLLQSPAPLQTRYLDTLEDAAASGAAAPQAEELMSESEFEATYHGGARSTSASSAPSASGSPRVLCLGV